MGTIGLQSGLPEKSPALPWASNIAQKREMIVQPCRRRLLETPFAPFNEGIFTPTDRFYALGHRASIPEPWPWTISSSWSGGRSSGSPSCCSPISSASSSASNLFWQFAGTVIRAGSVDDRFGGLDDALVPDAQKFLKSLEVDHALDRDVMIATP
jgi:hypothetical protein